MPGWCTAEFRRQLLSRKSFQVLGSERTCACSHIICIRAYAMKQTFPSVFHTWTKTDVSTCAEVRKFQEWMLCIFCFCAHGTTSWLSQIMQLQLQYLGQKQISNYHSEHWNVSLQHFVRESHSHFSNAAHEIPLPPWPHRWDELNGNWRVLEANALMRYDHARPALRLEKSTIEAGCSWSASRSYLKKMRQALHCHIGHRKAGWLDHRTLPWSYFKCLNACRHGTSNSKIIATVVYRYALGTSSVRLDVTI